MNVAAEGSRHVVRMRTSRQAPARARREVRRLLSGAAGRTTVDTAVLLTSELVTNAVRYGDIDEIVMTVECGPDSIRVSVLDASPLPPRLTTAPLDGVGGRGILMVDHMASGWGISPDGSGKSVWFRLDL